MIINELEYAQTLLDKGFIQPYHKRFKDVFILIKYYKELGLSMLETYKAIIIFLHKYDSCFDEDLCHVDIEKIHTITYNTYNKDMCLKTILDVPITKSEATKILALKTYKQRLLALTLLVLNKHISTSEYVKATKKDLAKIIDSKEQNINIIIDALVKKEVIQNTRYLNKYKILILDNQSEIVHRVKSIDNMSNELQKIITLLR